jgi:nifR3 family TIM-barrel protein
MDNIWQKLPRPFFVLAPMEDVTDSVFRRLIAHCGRPDLFFTEFTSVEGLESSGREKVIHRLRYTKDELPLIAQIWGITPENYYQSAKLAREMGFDGLDINMGCPVPKIIKQGACSALITNPSLAGEIIAAAKEGAGSMPVSVKTRIGFKEIITEKWTGFLLEQGIAALTVHGRTVKQLSKEDANWDEIAKVVKLRNQMNLNTPIIGNGDVTSYQKGLEYVKEYGVDGIMIGRGVFQNPWIFNPNKDIDSVTLLERLQLMQKHVEMFQVEWEGEKHMAILKKFFKIYLQSFPGASDYRIKYMEADSYEEILQLLQQDIITTS